MRSDDCAFVSDWERCVDYVAGTLPAVEAERLEGHYFSCTECALQVARVARLAVGVRAAARTGRVLSVAPASFVEKLRQEGVRLHEHVLSGRGAYAWFDPGDEVLVVRLPDPPPDVRRIDVEFENEWDGAILREQGIVVRSGEALFITCTRHHFVDAGTGVLHAKCRMLRADGPDRSVLSQIDLTLRSDAGEPV